MMTAAAEPPHPPRPPTSPAANAVQRAEVAAGAQAVPAVMLLGVPVHAVTLDHAAEHVVRSAQAGSGGWVITPNLDILRRTVRDPEFRRMYDLTTLRLADGMPLVWASRLKGTPLPERAAGSDLIFALAAKAAAQGASIFLLGGNPGAAEKCAAVLCEKHSGLRIAGIECPAPGFESDNARMEQLIARVRSASPDIVFVALGSPKQEKLIETLRQHLPRAWFLGIGITFSFVAGEVKRAPMWMRKTGLEWLHRMAQEPRRLVKRYLIDGLPFAARLIAVSTFEGLRGARPGAATPA